MSELQGKWIWYELMTADPEGSKAFYEAVVGWRMTLGDDAPMHYGMIASTDGAGDPQGFGNHTGGILPLTADMLSGGARPGWYGYIGVDDCDAAVAAIAAEGGKAIMPPSDVAGVGRFAMVTDPDGVPFYVMTPEMPEGAGGSTCFDHTLVGRCAWNELQAGNYDGALAFYTGQFGWTLPEPMDMGPMGKYQFIAHGGDNIGAIIPKMAQAPYPHWQYYFRVADIDAAVALMRANGGRLYNGPHQIPGGDWIIHGGDPQGVVFALVGARPGEQPGA